MRTLAIYAFIFITFGYFSSIALAERCNDSVAYKLRTFEEGKVPLRTIYIRNVPGATFYNGSYQNPYPNIPRAVQAGVLPGDKLLLQGIVHNTWDTGSIETLLQGTAQHPITIEGDPDAELRGVVDSWLPALKLAAGSHHIVIKNLTMRNGGSHVLHANYVDNLVLSFVKMFNAREAVFKLSQSSNVFVRDSEFAGAGAYPGGNGVATQGVDYVNVNNGYFVRSKVHDAPHTLLMLKGVSTNIFVGWNDLYNQSGGTEEPALLLGGFTGNPIMPLNGTYEGFNLVAFANNVYGTATPFAFRGCQNCAALHNSFQGSGPQMIRYLAGNAGPDSGLDYSQTRNTLFRSNVISGGDSQTPIMQCQDGYLGGNNVVRNNVIYNPSGVNLWWCGSIAQNNSNVLNHNPSLNQEGHVTQRRFVGMQVPTQFSGIPYGDLMIVDKAGACMGGEAGVNIGPYDFL